MGSRPERSGVTARVLDVLGAFTAAAPELGLTALSRRTGLPLTTVHRIAGELVAGGALERGADGRYRIGLRLWEIAHLAPASHGLREAAMPFLEDLHEVTRHNVQLAVLDPDDPAEVVYVERLSRHDAVSIRSRSGSRLPSTATGVGLVLLAHADPADTASVLARPLRRFTPFTVCDPDRVRALLAQVRTGGFVISDRQVEQVSLSVAAPVRGADGTVVAALSVVVPAAGTNPHTWVPVVRATARGISRALAAR
ncbi:IclR family transcriptional regulator [Pseudonocardia sp. HH130630-07]|uniref:IclR family transcriptional regulator n=1 Tax=Pseudonocardia sp. HH130630-07 TaxID=1690815 RepID=UPI000814FEE6|nr:IclR family transcriptional regulator [Pseudonocardia sp. HH130630-07]ANY07945.1 IclR family transcriptional regulator [Pseudonocardia sp. HH130630-07]